MFDFLKGGQANLTLTLDRANKIYAPGETINAKLTVQGVKDLKIQGGLITLVTREEYQHRYQDESTDSDGRTSTETVTRKETDERKLEQQQFLNETTIKGGTNQTFDFTFPLPPDALPTVDGGKILNLEWRVKATLDRKLRGDVETFQVLYVPKPFSGTMGGAGEFGTSNSPSDAQLSLRLSNREYAPGDTISGEFVMVGQKEFDVTEIRIELERFENVPEDQGNTFKDKQAVKLAGSTKLKPGQNMVMPFQIKIPTGAPITCRTPHGSIRWTLRGVLARRMRGDTLVEQEILVSSSPQT